MTVSSVTTKKSYNGDGSTTVFAYDFKIFDDDDITVIIKTDSTGAEAVKTKTTHYTVSGVGVTTGGNITFGSAPASGETVVLLRSTAQTQTTDYTPNDPFPAASHEDALDKLTFITQEIAEQQSRSIKISRTNAMTSTEFTVGATARANKLLGFDGSGELSVTEGKVDTVSATASSVSVGGSPTASATYTVATGALALALGIPTGATGNSAGLQMTFSNSTSDADPGAGKLAFNNGTVSSVSILFIDDADDNAVDISGFVQSFDDITNSVARGIIHVEKEGTPSTFATFKVSGAVTDASGYTKVPVTHVISNGSFSNADGLRVDFSYSGQDAGSTDLSSDSSPQLGGNLDVVTHDIVSTSNRNIDIVPNGNGDVTLQADTVQVGDNNANATVTTNGTGDLILNTNAGTNSGAITILDGSNGNITIVPNGTGNVSLGNLIFNADQSVGAGQDNFVLTFDNSSSTISLEAASAAGATGGGSDEIFYENGQAVTANYTITNGKNAMSAGPITVNNGVTITVGSGETYTVV